MFLIVCFLFIATTFQAATASSMVICDYDKIVHRWLAFETNASFLDHDEDVISAHCSRLRDLFQDEGVHEVEGGDHEVEGWNHEDEGGDHEDEGGDHEDEGGDHEDERDYDVEGEDYDEFFVNATEL
jgi:hypothetical protein